MTFMKFSIYGFIAIILAIWTNQIVAAENSDNTPRLSLQPLPESSSLIRYENTKLENVQQITTKLDEFLAKYNDPSLTPKRTENLVNCDYNYPPAEGKVCHIDVRQFGECNHENHFSYHKSAPCVFLKLDIADNWIPEYYNDSKKLPENMPQFLKEQITELERTNPEKMNNVWVSCDGEKPMDREFIGTIEQKPNEGFPGYLLQNSNVEGFLSPLVAIHFRRPTIGVVIFVECKLWAVNIKHEPQNNLGSTRFQLLLD